MGGKGCLVNLVGMNLWYIFTISISRLNYTWRSKSCTSKFALYFKKISTPSCEWGFVAYTHGQLGYVQLYSFLDVPCTCRGTCLHSMFHGKSLQELHSLQVFFCSHSFPLQHPMCFPNSLNKYLLQANNMWTLSLIFEAKHLMSN